MGNSNFSININVKYAISAPTNEAIALFNLFVKINKTTPMKQAVIMITLINNSKTHFYLNQICIKFTSK